MSGRMQATPDDQGGLRIREGYHVVDAPLLVSRDRAIDVNHVTVDVRFRYGVPVSWVIEMRGCPRDATGADLVVHTVAFDPSHHRDPELKVQALVPLQAQPMFDRIASAAARLGRAPMASAS